MLVAVSPPGPLCCRSYSVVWHFILNLKHSLVPKRLQPQVISIRAESGLINNAQTARGKLQCHSNVVIVSKVLNLRDHGRAGTSIDFFRIFPANINIIKARLFYS
jgi:hypothetical protein